MGGIRLVKRSVTVLVLAAFLTVPAFGSAGPGDAPLLVPTQGPDVPPVTEPVAERVALEAELWRWTAGFRTTTIDVPDAAWNRVLLEYHSWPNQPNGDPWDRTFIVAIDGTEVLHGTTPRGDFTIVEDVTEYASLLRPGDSVDVGAYLDSWAGNGLYASVTLRFYAEPTAAAGDAPFDAVVSPFLARHVGAASTSVTFPEDAPSRAVVELFTSGHGQAGEFWWMETWPTVQQGPPHFEVRVDGTTVGTVEAMPYVYALLGFSGSDAAVLINQYGWWSAHQALDRAGVHHGVGEIPSYRAELPEALLPLLAGERTVEVVRTTHGGSWPTSVSFLLDA